VATVKANSTSAMLVDGHPQVAPTGDALTPTGVTVGTSADGQGIHFVTMIFSVCRQLLGQPLPQR